MKTSEVKYLVHLYIYLFCGWEEWGHRLQIIASSHSSKIALFRYESGTYDDSSPTVTNVQNKLKFEIMGPAFLLD